MTNINQPREFDTVLGGKANVSIQNAVLGGIQGVKQRLASPFVKARLAAVSDALKYGNAGLSLLIQALDDDNIQVQRITYLLLRERTEYQVKQALKEYRIWSLPERFNWDKNWYSDTYLQKEVTKFANREVRNFELETSIIDPAGTAYALKIKDDFGRITEAEDITDKFKRLLQVPEVSKIEALVFGRFINYSYFWRSYNKDEDTYGDIIVDLLVSAKKYLTSLKAIFIGDLHFGEHGFFPTYYQLKNISPILEAYPKLEVLQVRGRVGLEFTSLQHDNLKAMIVEMSRLSPEIISQICSLKLPALQHLELWLGEGCYDGKRKFEEEKLDKLTPILSGSCFPILSYLGLRNSSYSDHIAEALVNAPVLNSLNVLDLSMGTLGKQGVKALLKCPAINKLDILNVCENYLYDWEIEQLNKLDVEVISYCQKYDECIVCSFLP